MSDRRSASMPDMPIETKTARLVYRSGKWEAVELDGVDVRPLIHTVLVEATPDTLMHPLVHLVLEPGAVELDIEREGDTVTTGDPSQGYDPGELADALLELDVARLCIDNNFSTRPDDVVLMLSRLIRAGRV